MPRVPITRRRAKGKPGQRSANKGGSYERLLARRLSAWVTNGVRDDCFWRTACSGGASTYRTRRGVKETHHQNTHAGDLLLTHPRGRLLLDLFMIELKHQKTLHLEQVFFLRPSSDLLRFWDELQGKAFPLGRIPLLITKRTSIGELLTTTREGVRILNLGQRRNFPRLQPTVVVPSKGMIVFLLKDVLESINFARIRKHY